MTNQKKKIPNILCAIPFEMFGATGLNIALKNPNLSFPNLFNQVQSTFYQNGSAVLRASATEIIFHRLAKVVGSEIAAKEISVERFGYVGSVVGPTAVVCALEYPLSPLHLAMTQVQSGKAKNLTAAIRTTFKHAGLRGVYNGGAVFALKGCFFTPGQIAVWRFFEDRYDRKLHEMDAFQRSSAYFCGAIGGTFTAAIPTRVFQLCSMNPNLSVTRIMMDNVKKSPYQFIKGAYHPQALLFKAGTKAPSHVIQYNLGSILVSVRDFVERYTGS